MQQMGGWVTTVEVGGGVHAHGCGGVPSASDPISEFHAKPTVGQPREASQRALHCAKANAPLKSRNINI